MKRLWHLVILLIAGSGCIAQAQEQAIVFEGATVLPMDGERILENHTVVIRGDRIVAVTPAEDADVPAGATRIDGRNKFLIPGLAEMHGHIPSPDSPGQFVDDVLFMFVANGVTTVRGMLGWPGQLELRERANRGEILSPTLYLAGPSFSGNSINSPEQAEQRVREQVREGWDLLKVHPGLTRDEYDAMATAAREEGIRFGGHVPSDVGILHAIEMGQETFDHLDGYVEYLDGDQGPIDEEELQKLVDLSRDAGVWVVPTMALWEVLRGTLDYETVAAYPELQYMPPDMVENWKTSHRNRLASENFNETTAKNVIENRVRVLRALHEGGVPVLMGTDAPQQFSVPGFSHHREFERMLLAGMTPYDILKSGSYNVGLYFDESDHFGTIAAGQRADLVLLNADPLEDIGNIADRAGVMVRGRWLSEEDIQARLSQIAASHHELQ